MSRATTRQAHKKRKQECTDCKSFIGNRKTYDEGICSKGLKTTCYRQSKKKCCEYELELGIITKT